jgi:hypothetical protein
VIIGPITKERRLLPQTLLGLGGGFFDTDIPGVCGKIK